MRNKKFTLLELLIVVCIILVLLSLMMPAVRKSIQRAKFAVCTSNIGQIYRGVYLYSNVNAMRFPVAYNRNTGHSWDDLLSPLLGRPITEEEMALNGIPVTSAACKGTVFACPSYKNGEANRRSYATTGGWGGPYGVAVGGSTSTYGPAEGWSQKFPKGKGDPSDKIVYREDPVGGDLGSGWNAYSNFDWGSGNGVHHKGKNYQNAVFKDGHVEYIPQSTFESRWFLPGDNSWSIE